MNIFPDVRLRRMRMKAGLRGLLSAPDPAWGSMIWPVFVVEGTSVQDPIATLPGQSRMSVDVLCRELEPLVAGGLGGILLFGVPHAHVKTSDGAAAYAEDGVVPRAVRRIKAAYPDLPLFTDVCLCSYTSHGHCGPLLDGTVDNDAALVLLAAAARVHAEAGADGVAPSAMMDGQVQAIRRQLNDVGLSQTVIMSYAVKFASACYGPFRDAAASAPQAGDRRGYQMGPGSVAEALREAQLDEQEGADILMVKPATFYLDVIAAVRAQSKLPLAAYNVSGEYTMLHALANSGGGDLHALVRENMMAIRRAGADILITYWANQYRDIYGQQ
ncbi:MAG: porphobilinogen synthase [Kiritimatiellia bacterium]